MSEFWSEFRKSTAVRLSGLGVGVGMLARLVANGFAEPRKVPANTPVEEIAPLAAQYLAEYAATQTTAGWVAAASSGALLGLVGGFVLGLLFDWFLVGWHLYEEMEEYEDYIGHVPLGEYKLQRINVPKVVMIRLGYAASGLLGVRRVEEQAYGGTDVIQEIGSWAERRAARKARQEAGLEPKPKPIDVVMVSLLYGVCILVWMGALQVLVFSAYRRLDGDSAMIAHVVLGVIGLGTGLWWAIVKDPLAPPRRSFGSSTVASYGSTPRPLWGTSPVTGIGPQRSLPILPGDDAPKTETRREFWKQVSEQANAESNANAFAAPDSLRVSVRVLLLVATVDGAVGTREAEAVVDAIFSLGEHSLADVLGEIDEWASGRTKPPQTRAEESELIKRAAISLDLAQRRKLLHACARVAASEGGIDDRERGLLSRLPEGLGLTDSDLNEALYSVRRIVQQSIGEGKGAVRTARGPRTHSRGGTASDPNPMTRKRAWMLAGVPEELAAQASTRRPPPGLAQSLLKARIEPWCEAADLAEANDASDVVKDVIANRLLALNEAEALLTSTDPQ